MSSSDTPGVDANHGNDVAEDLANDVLAVRSRICNAFLVVMAIVALPALAASLYRINLIGWQPVMAAHIVIAVTLFSFAILLNRVPYTLRAGFLLVIFFIIGIGGLWQFGLIAGGTVFIMATGPIAAMFFGGRAGISVLLLSLLSAASIGILIVSGHVRPVIDLVTYATSPAAWANAFFGWALVGSSLTVSIFVFNKNLIAALEGSRQHEANLRSHQKGLEKTIEERTEVLRRSNEDLELFAQIAAHDMRSPLNVISGYAQLLGRNYSGKLDDEADEHLQEIIQSANHVNAMVADLLDYSKLDSEASSFAPVDMNAVLLSTKKQLLTEIAASAATIDSENLPMVTADEVQMIRVMQNLLANAMRYRKQDEPLVIHVSALRDEGNWRIAVSDNGIGIEPEQVAEIFQIFKKASGVSNMEGAGIGLAVCRKIVERHGGRIWLESKVGQGSTFYFTLKPVVSD